MRCFAIFAGLALLPGSLAEAQLPAPSTAPVGQTAGQPAIPAALPADATVDQTLDALDQRGRDLQQFTANVSMTAGDPSVGDPSTHTGRVWFDVAGGGRIHVLFDKLLQGKIAKDDKLEYLLDKGWLIDRNYHKKDEIRRQVTQPGEKTNLLKLGEGPFPLPIGQRKEEVHKQFSVTLVQAAKDDPKELADTIHLQLRPKAGTRFAKHFGVIDVWVDRTSRFPVRIATDNPDQSEPRETNLKDVQVNPPGGLKDADFTLPPIDQNEWSFHSEAYQG